MTVLRCARCRKRLGDLVDRRVIPAVGIVFVEVPGFDVTDLAALVCPRDGDRDFPVKWLRSPYRASQGRSELLKDEILL